MGAETAALAASAAQSLGGIMGNVTNAWLQTNANRKNREWSENMYNRQRQDALADWQMQAQYNSPEEQMRRFKQAGLNPNLIYGQGASASNAQQVRSADAPNYKQEAPRLDMSFIGDSVGMYNNVLSAAQDRNLKQQQTNNLKAQEEAIKANTNLINNRILDSILGRSVKEWDWQLNKDLRDTTIGTKKEQLDLLKLVKQQRTDLFQTTLAAKQASVDKIYNDIKINNARLGMDKVLFPSTIVSKMFENKIKILDMNIKNAQSKEAKEYYAAQRTKLVREASSLYWKNQDLFNTNEFIRPLEKQRLEQQIRLLKGQYTQEDTYWTDKILQVFGRGQSTKEPSKTNKTYNIYNNK